MIGGHVRERPPTCHRQCSRPVSTCHRSHPVSTCHRSHPVSTCHSIPSSIRSARTCQRPAPRTGSSLGRGSSHLSRARRRCLRRRSKTASARGRRELGDSSRHNIHLGCPTGDRGYIYVTTSAGLRAVHIKGGQGRAVRWHAQRRARAERAAEDRRAQLGARG